MIFETKLPYYLHHIKAQSEITKDTLLTDDLLIKTEGDLSMYYAPHNEYVNTQANIVIVGLTPGWNQMKIAYTKLLESMNNSKATEDLLKDVKIAASFSGQMRRNLIAMLDEIGLNEILHITSTEELFSTKRSFIHTTSLIRYPVFYKGKNYTGHTPVIDQSNLLTTYAYQVFPKELALLSNHALIIPLGKAVERVICSLPKNNYTYLDGFPHPSGANGHRAKQLHQNKESMIQQLQGWQNQMYI